MWFNKAVIMKMGVQESMSISFLNSLGIEQRAVAIQPH